MLSLMELELEGIVLGTEPRSSVRTVNALRGWASLSFSLLVYFHFFSLTFFLGCEFVFKNLPFLFGEEFCLFLF